MHARSSGRPWGVGKMRVARYRTSRFPGPASAAALLAGALLAGCTETAPRSDPAPPPSSLSPTSPNPPTNPEPSGGDERVPTNPIIVHDAQAVARVRVVAGISEAVASDDSDDALLTATLTTFKTTQPLVGELPDTFQLRTLSSSDGATPFRPGASYVVFVQREESSADSASSAWTISETGGVYAQTEAGALELVTPAGDRLPEFFASLESLIAALR